MGVHSANMACRHVWLRNMHQYATSVQVTMHLYDGVYCFGTSDISPKVLVCLKISSSAFRGHRSGFSVSRTTLSCIASQNSPLSQCADKHCFSPISLGLFCIFFSRYLLSSSLLCPIFNFPIHVPPQIFASAWCICLTHVFVAIRGGLIPWRGVSLRAITRLECK